MFATYKIWLAIIETLLSSIYIVFLLSRYEEDDPSAAFISPICSHFVDQITVCTLFGLFILRYFINMHYGHMASDKEGFFTTDM